jgi:3-oxoadipate enol-lactonase
LGFDGGVGKDQPMPFADLPGVRTYFEIGGSGPRLVVINGTGSDLRNRPTPFEWPISEQFEILSFDHRGLGQSEPADPNAQPTMADFGADVLALLDHVGWDSCAVLGISFGGMVAQEVAIAAPERVTRLVLACTSSGGEGGASYPLHDLYSLPADERAAIYMTLTDTRASEPGPVRDWVVAVAARRPQLPVVPPGLQRQLEARRLHDTWDRLGTITAPTLVASGAHDGIAPPQNGEGLASRIAGSTLQLFDGGHIFRWQDAAAWPAIGEFLATSHTSHPHTEP